MCIHAGPCKYNLHFCHSKIVTCSRSNRMAEIMMHTSGWYQTAQVNIKLSLCINTKSWRHIGNSRGEWTFSCCGHLTLEDWRWLEGWVDSRTGLNVVVMRKVCDPGKSQTLVIQPLTTSRYEAAHIVIHKIQNWERNYSNLSKRFTLHHWCIL